jgi:hypothetical protein
METLAPGSLGHSSSRFRRNAASDDRLEQMGGKPFETHKEFCSRCSRPLVNAPAFLAGHDGPCEFLRQRPGLREKIWAHGSNVFLLQAVLCAECDIVSDSPHDTCTVCGSRSLFNISRVFGGKLPEERASLMAQNLVEAATGVVLMFPEPHRLRKRATTGSHNSQSSRSTIMIMMKLSVECYSGRKADERPVRFWLDGRQYQVEAVIDQWHDPESIFYKVRVEDRNLYIRRKQYQHPTGCGT